MYFDIINLCDVKYFDYFVEFVIRKYEVWKLYIKFVCIRVFIDFCFLFF